MKTNTDHPLSLTDIIEIGNTYETMPAALRKKIDILRQRAERSQQNTLTIGVFGAFTRGKSSFINALLGCEILPTNLLPATAIPHVLVYNDELQVWTSKKNKKPVREEIEALTRYMALGDPTAAEVVSISIGIPSDYLRRNLRIIDTPGIGAVFSDHYKISLKCIQECDVAIVVLSSEPLISEVECQFIQEIRNKVAEMVFIQTKIDRESNWQEKVEFNESVVQTKIGLRQAKIYPVSSDLMWQYRKTGLQATYESSHFPSLEEKLADTLGRRRHRIIAAKDAILIHSIAGHFRQFLQKEISRGKEQQKQLMAQRERIVSRQTASKQVTQLANRNVARVAEELEHFMKMLRTEFLAEFETYLQNQPLTTIAATGQASLNQYATKTLERIQQKVKQLQTESILGLPETLRQEVRFELDARNSHRTLAPFPATSISLEYRVIYKDKQNQAGTGLAIGATIGTFVFPVVGTAVGAILGALVGNGINAQPETNLEATKDAIRNGTVPHIENFFQINTSHIQKETAKWAHDVSQTVDDRVEMQHGRRKQSIATVENALSSCRKKLRLQETHFAQLQRFK